MFSAAASGESVPLTTPLPGIEVPTFTATATKTDTTTLSSGLKVVTENTPGVTACVGVFVGAGSRNETDATSGATQLMEHMAYKTAAGRSHFRNVHEVEHMGASLIAQAGREEIVYSAEILSENVPQLLEVMANTIQSPLFEEHEIAEQKGVCNQEIEDAQMNSQGLVTEAAHLAAFGNTGLGRQLMGSPKAVNSLNSASLKSYFDATFTAGNTVVAAAGVDHKEFVGQVESFFAMPSGGAPAVEKAAYKGGHYSVTADSMDGLAHVVLGFEGPSWHDADLIPMCVLHTLMGGGGSFSAGGPGKGMYSRLYTEVLNNHGWVENATAFNNCYSDSGIFGVYGATEPKHVSSLVQVLAVQLKGMAGDLGDEAISRAKNMTKSSVLMNLESKPIVLEDMGKQVLCYGKRISAAEVCSQIDSVTAADIKKVAQKMLGSQLTYSGYGEVHSLPRYDEVANFMK
jgi:processing peptidase subunit alpha